MNTFAVDIEMTRRDLDITEDQFIRRYLAPALLHVKDAVKSPDTKIRVSIEEIGNEIPR